VEPLELRIACGVLRPKPLGLIEKNSVHLSLDGGSSGLGGLAFSTSSRDLSAKDLRKFDSVPEKLDSGSFTSSGGFGPNSVPNVIPIGSAP
jgi:hypothetical protein